MASRFAAAMGRADAALDAHMGEAVEVVPMRKTDFGAAPDPDRPAFRVVALVSDDDPSATNVQGLEARIVHEQWRVEIRRELLGDRRVGKGDEVILLDRRGSPRVTVTMIERLDAQRLALLCGPVRER